MYDCAPIAGTKEIANEEIRSASNEDKLPESTETSTPFNAEKPKMFLSNTRVTLLNEQEIAK